MHRVRLLRHYGVTPLLVFDGAPLPAKAITEQERALYVINYYFYL
jgi:exonuclease-1